TAYSSALARFSSFFFSSRRRHTICYRDWSSDVCSSDLDHQQFKQCEPVPIFSRYSHCTKGLNTAGRGLFRPNTRDEARRAERVQIGRASCRERGEKAGGGGVVKRSNRREMHAWSEREDM